MKITIVYDNTTHKSGVVADWGFSCFIETKNRCILFDTGGNGKILIDNLESLDILPGSVDDIVISHPDFDHIGGLSAFLNSNNKAVVHVPISFRGIRYPNKVKYYDKPSQVYENVFLTGELGQREQSLAIKSDKGLVLIIGCGHPGVHKIMKSISKFGNVFAIVGGLHGFADFDILKNVEIVCPIHCTKNKDKIKSLYPEKCIEGGVGKRFKIVE